MAIQGPFKIDCTDLFPYGVAVCSAVTAQGDFEASTATNKVQSRDRNSGQLVWVVDVLDFDPDARERTFKVKVLADVQPVPPEVMAGTPLRPVYLEGLQMTPYIKDGNFPKVAYSLRCTGLAAPKRGHVDKAA